MSYISNIVKSGVASQLSQIKSADVGSKIESAASSLGVNVKVPDLGKPLEGVNIKLDGPALNEIKMPAGMTNYIPPAVTKLVGDVKLPSEIGNLKLPSMDSLPELSSVSSELQGALSNVGINLKDLGIRDVDSILEEPNLVELSKVPTFSSYNPDNVKDIMESSKDIDISGIQADLANFSSAMSADIDISKYF